MSDINKLGKRARHGPIDPICQIMGACLMCSIVVRQFMGPFMTMGPLCCGTLIWKEAVSRALGWGEGGNDKAICPAICCSSRGLQHLNLQPLSCADAESHLTCVRHCDMTLSLQKEQVLERSNG